VLLHFFKRCKTFPDILVEFLLHLVGNSQQLGVNPVANGVQAVRRLLIQVSNSTFRSLVVRARELVSSSRACRRVVRLFAASAGQLSINRAANLR